MCDFAIGLKGRLVIAWGEALGEIVGFANSGTCRT